MAPTSKIHSIQLDHSYVVERPEIRYVAVWIHRKPYKSDPVQHYYAETKLRIERLRKIQDAIYTPEET